MICSYKKKISILFEKLFDLFLGKRDIYHCCFYRRFATNFLSFPAGIEYKNLFLRLFCC